MGMALKGCQAAAKVIRQVGSEESGNPQELEVKESQWTKVKNVIRHQQFISCFLSQVTGHMLPAMKVANCSM